MGQLLTKQVPAPLSAESGVLQDELFLARNAEVELMAQEEADAGACTP